MEKTIVTFHIGRGGRFNNGGYRSFYDNCKITEVPLFQELFAPVSGYDEDGYAVEDEKPAAEWTDGSGNSVELTNEMVKTGVGYLDYDGDYDTYYSMYLDECDEQHLAMILDAGRDDLVKEYIEDYTDLKVEWDRLYSYKWRDLIELAFINGAEIDEEEFYEEE